MNQIKQSYEDEIKVYRRELATIHNIAQNAEWDGWDKDPKEALQLALKKIIQRCEAALTRESADAVEPESSNTE